jgi:cytoskeletal protein CcmA (bactofilin family)
MADEDGNEQQQQERGKGRHRDGSSHVTLGPRDVLNGTLKIEGDLTVRGKVEGEVHTSGDISVENSANVKATLEGSNVTVQGHVTGNVVARGKLTLAGSGSLHGDVKVAKLAVEDGATLNGNVSMTPNVGGGSGGGKKAEGEQPHGEGHPEGG